jgi:protein SCO1
MSRLFVATFALGVSLLTAPALVCAKPVDPGQVPTRTERVPKRMQGVDVAEHLGSPIGAKLAFRDEAGRDVLLGELLRADGALPTLVTFNYSDCPMLCSLQLNALVQSLRQIDLTLGRDYRIVTVSLNPKDTPDRLRDMKARYVAQYGRPESRDGWTFLSGSGNNIAAAAREFGISYNYNEARDEYVHPAAFSVLTPKGVIARYLYGLEYHPQTVRLSLVEASEGKIGSSFDRLVLYCFHYDASEGRYAPMAMNIMRLSGSAGALALGGLLTGFWRAERKRKPEAKTAS